jgi:hypothetical protein
MVEVCRFGDRAGRTALVPALLGDRLNRVHYDRDCSRRPPVVIRTAAHRGGFASPDFYLMPEEGIQLKLADWPEHITVAGIRLHQYEITGRPADASLSCDLPRFLFRRLLRLILIRLRHQAAARQPYGEHNCPLHLSHPRRSNSVILTF